MRHRFALAGAGEREPMHPGRYTVEAKTEAQYDLVVIGTGPGGEGAAMQAAKHGLSVAAVERYQLIGGGCTHWGTIPSKSLRHAISQMTDVNSNPLFHAAGMSIHLSIPELR